MVTIFKTFQIFIKQRFCKHEFYTHDMQPRNENGIVKWHCHKCKRLFQAECGIDILSNGKCIGHWGNRAKQTKQEVEG